MFVELRYGSLEIEVHDATWPLSRLCGFASRKNPKRPFLIVSKILGKHIACDPSQQVLACDELLSRMPKLPEPICVIGFAETATGLSQTLFERLVHSGTEQAVFTHTTRYRLDHPLALTLEESHSHATSHRIYQPQSAEASERFHQARSLLIVDDEFTTGNTAVNLVTAYAEKNPHLEHIALVCLTDWMAAGKEPVSRIGRITAADVTSHSLLRGTLKFHARTETPPLAVASAVGDDTSRDWCLPHSTGRLAMNAVPSFDFEAMLRGFPLAKQVAVVGTGEYMYPPSLLARWLAERGHDVTIQSSTRSPIQIGGAIGGCIESVDNYHDGIANYLYNHQTALASKDRTTLLCYETDPLPEQHDLAAQLGAAALFPNRFLV